MLAEVFCQTIGVIPPHVVFFFFHIIGLFPSFSCSTYFCYFPGIALKFFLYLPFILNSFRLILRWSFVSVFSVYLSVLSLFLFSFIHINCLFFYSLAHHILLFAYVYSFILLLYSLLFTIQLKCIINSVILVSFLFLINFVIHGTFRSFIHYSFLFIYSLPYIYTFIPISS